MNTEINGMRPTCSLKSVIEREVRDDPFSTFIKYPLFEVRRACLKRINEIQGIYSFHADWAETIIKRLQELGDNDMWKEILEWYLNAAEDKNWHDEYALILRRAIEFALALSHKEEGLVSKLLAGRLKKAAFSADVYNEIPSLKNFFCRLFRNLYWEDSFRRRKNSTGGLRRSGEYSDERWYRARRSIEVAVLAGDFSFIDRLGDVIFLMEQGVIHSDRFAHWAEDDERLGYLIAAEKCLKNAKRNAAEEESEKEPE